MSDGGAALTYAFTFGHYLRKHGWTDVRSLSWDGLAALLTTHEVGPKAGTCIVPAVFAGGRRKQEGVRRQHRRRLPRQRHRHDARRGRPGARLRSRGSRAGCR